MVRSVIRPMLGPLWLCMLILWVGQIAPVKAAEIADGFEAKVKNIVDEERARAGVPGMSVAVVANGKVVSLYASGMADVEAGIPATTDTLFPAASVAKLLTAVMVMREVERGHLSLDANVNELLPLERQVRDSAGTPVAVTLRHLLTHSSGLEGGRGGAGYQPDPSAKPKLLDDYLSTGLVVVQPPGTSIIYSNNGFALAGWLAAHGQREEFDAFAQRELLSPIGMAHSSFKAPNEVGPNLAAGYGEIGLAFNPGRIPHPIVTSYAPAGALVTTANDLSRFAIAILNGGEIDGVRVLEAATLDAMTHIIVRQHPSMPEGFGLGFAVNDIPGRRLAWWDGSISGAAARVALLPDQKVGVVILTNLQDAEAPARVSSRILDLLAPSTAQAVVRLDSEALAKFAGKYQILHALDKRMWFVSWLVEASVATTESGLVVSMPLSRNPIEYVPVAPNLFQVKGNAAGTYLAFEGDDMYLSTALHGKRMPALKTSRAIFAYVGVAALLVISFFAWGLYRLIRRIVRRRESAPQTS